MLYFSSILLSSSESAIMQGIVIREVHLFSKLSAFWFAFKILNTKLVGYPLFCNPLTIVYSNF